MQALSEVEAADEAWRGCAGSSRLVPFTDLAVVGYAVEAALQLSSDLFSTEVWERSQVVVYRDALVEAECQEDRVDQLVADVGSRIVI